MMRSFIILLIALFSSPVFSGDIFCDSGKPHQIDVWLEKAMSQTAGVTVNIRNAQSEAYARWDKELNRIYHELMMTLKKADKIRLREAQRAWIKFRDAEVAWYWSGAMYGQGGSLATIIVSDIRRGYVRQRVCNLMRYKKMAYDANS